MKSKDGRKTLYGARVPKETQLNDTIEFYNPDTKETNPVFVRFAKKVAPGVFSELDVLSINKSRTIVYTWAEDLPDPLITEE
jgi:hypothetical protein